MSLAYRPEVDGLRCIAVLIVILNHLNIFGFAGGFVGVDVFFVISGYLITSIILKEIKNGEFSFSRFYKRRVIRLAPAYFIVVLVTAFIAYMFMLPQELHNFSVSVFYSTFFSANFYMWNAVGGYFGSGADTTPLLHLWSLAVEEQFYLFWPIVIVFVYRFFKGVKLFLFIFVILLLALIFSEWGAVNYRAAAYYLMPTRAFELIMGAMLALIPSAFFLRTPLTLRMILGGIGMGLIFYGSVFFDSSTWYPGVNALFPCIGTFLVIAFVWSRDPFIGYILSSRIFVGIGKISYPAYLWHWPIIAFLNLQLVELTAFVSFAVLGLTFSLAYLSYQFVEKPARRLKAWRWQAVVMSGFVLPAIIISSVAWGTINSEGFPHRFDEALIKRSNAVLSYAYDIRGRCNEGPVISPVGPDDCILGVQKPEVDFLLLGDSHANHFTGMFDVLASDAGVRGYDVTQSQSPFLVDVNWYYKQGEKTLLHKNMKSRNEFVKNELISNEYDYVVLAGSFVNYLRQGLFSFQEAVPDISQPGVFREAMIRTIDLIVENGSTPILVKGNPIFSSDVSHCTLNNIRFGLNKKCFMLKSEYQKNFYEWSGFVDELESRFESLIVVDPAQVMCDEDKCYTEIEGVPLYKDAGHLNYEGSKLIGELYIERYKNPFLNLNK